MAITIEILEKPGMVILKLCGDFDFKSNKAFRTARDSVLGKPGVDKIELDLSGITDIDSSALGMILHLQDKAKETKQTMTLTGAKETLVGVLAMGNIKCS